jgi:predicted Zn-dependent protease with MMP-like domain
MRENNKDPFDLNTLQDDLLLQEKAVREIGDNIIDQRNGDWIAEFEEDLANEKERFNKECPYLRKITKKYFPYAGDYEVHSFDGQYRLTFSRADRGKIKESVQEPRFFFIYFIDKHITKYEDKLSFEKVWTQVERDISQGYYSEWWPDTLITYRALNIKEEFDYLSEKGSATCLKGYEEKMDELLIHAFYVLPDFMQSHKAGVKLLIRHFEKRRTQLFDKKATVRQNASRFWKRLFAERGAQKKGEFPARLFISGLVSFLLPIAWNLHDKYLQNFPEHKKVIERDKGWRKKLGSLDPRLIHLEDSKELQYLITGGPKYYIERIFLPRCFNVSHDTIKNRILLTEKKN